MDFGVELAQYNFRFVKERVEKTSKAGRLYPVHHRECSKNQGRHDRVTQGHKKKKGTERILPLLPEIHHRKGMGEM